MTDYTLDIDETGRFVRADPWSCVVGWLRPGHPGLDDVALRRDLEAAFPSAWPFHATDANGRGDGEHLRRAVRGVLGGRGTLLLARMEDAPRPDIGRVAAHPYAYALRALLARAALLFREGGARVHLRVADRGIDVKSGPRTIRAFLHPVFVHEVARDAVKGLPTRADLLVVHTRFRMDESAPAGIVIADTLANRVGQLLRHDMGMPLAALSSALEAEFGIGVSVVGRARPLPTLAADGPCDQAIRDTLAAGAGRVPAGETWAEEQARLWIEEVAR